MRQDPGFNGMRVSAPQALAYIDVSMQICQLSRRALNTIDSDGYLPYY